MRVSYIAGVCVRYDAISNAVRARVNALRKAGVKDVRLYTYECHFEELPFTRVSGVSDIALDAHFNSTDVFLFEFGVYYPLFDLLATAPRPGGRLAVFHNITPKEHVSPSEYDVIEKSFRQRANIRWADHVVCDSETNLQNLRTAGIDTPATVLPLGVDMPAAPPGTKPGLNDGIVRLVFVGRFVRSKGPNDLLRALRAVWRSGIEGGIALDMIGNLDFSDSSIVEEVRRNAAKLEKESNRTVTVRIHGNAAEETKSKILARADIFALPTYHEGFCVPIIEAMAHGCLVVAYRNSNTPAISGDLAELTDTGDIDELSRTLRRTIRRVRSEEWRSSGPGSYATYLRMTRAHVGQFAPDRTAEAFVDFVVGWNARRSRGQFPAGDPRLGPIRSVAL